MAVIEINNPSSLKVKLDLGMVDCKTKTRSKSYSSLKYDASAQDAFDVGKFVFTQIYLHPHKCY